MRFLTGIIVGALLTVGLAFVHDSSLSASTPDREARALVNWPAFNSQMRTLHETLSAGWDRLSESLPRRS